MKMPLAEQLEHIKKKYPEGYDYLSSEITLPQFDENDELITKEEQKMKVFINPGHAPNGTPDPGACGCGLRESDVVATVGQLVAGYLTVAGCEVMLLQSDSLSEISDTANKWGADCFVSIHCNSASVDTARGAETYSFHGSSGGWGLNKCIQRQIVGAFEEIDDNFPNRGCRTANFHVIRETDMPAVLVELAFINNEQDAELLKKNTDDFARAIARGVTDYEQSL